MAQGLVAVLCVCHSMTICPAHGGICWAADVTFVLMTIYYDHIIPPGGVPRNWSNSKFDHIILTGVPRD